MHIINFSGNKTDGKRWRCNDYRCSGKLPLLLDSYFNNYPKTSLSELLLINFEYFSNLYYSTAEALRRISEYGSTLT